jgi:hypothetical protein
MSDLMDQPNREVLGLDPMMSQSNDAAQPKGKTGDKEPTKLPGQHAGLDELAAERGYEWSADDLTVAEKQAELEQAG